MVQCSCCWRACPLCSLFTVIINVDREEEVKLWSVVNADAAARVKWVLMSWARWVTLGNITKTIWCQGQNCCFEAFDHSLHQQTCRLDLDSDTLYIPDENWSLSQKLRSGCESGARFEMFLSFESQLELFWIPNVVIRICIKLCSLSDTRHTLNRSVLSGGKSQPCWHLRPSSYFHTASSCYLLANMQSDDNISSVIWCRCMDRSDWLAPGSTMTHSSSSCICLCVWTKTVHWQTNVSY